MRPSILGRLEDIVLEVAAALDVGAQVVPLAAARVAEAALPSQAEGRAWAAALSAAAGPQAVQQGLGAAAVLVGRPQLVLAVALPAEAQPAEAQPAAEELIAAQVWGFEPGVAATWPPGRASASRPEQWPAVRACLPEA